MRTVGDNMSSGEQTGLVDKLIGTSYDIVKSVAYNMQFIRTVESNIESLKAIGISIPGLNHLLEELVLLQFVADNLNEIIGRAGGWRSVATLEDLNTIPANQRIVGMGILVRGVNSIFTYKEDGTFAIVVDLQAALNAQTLAVAASTSALETEERVKLLRDAVAAQFEAVQTVARTGVGKVFKTWAKLKASTGNADEGAIVPSSDTGEHLDPVTKLIVPNSGTFSYSVNPAGWTYIAPLIGKGEDGKDSTIPGPRGPQGPSLPDLAIASGAKFIGFKVPMANTVLRDVAEKLSDFSVNVKDFGAECDGVTDDRIAIQRAIDTVWDEGNGTGVVRFPLGTSMISWASAVDGGVIGLIMRSGVSLIGESMFGSRIKLMDGMIGPGTYIRVIGSVGTVVNFEMSNIWIDGNSQGQGDFAPQGNGGNIVIGGRNVLIDKVKSTNGNGQGIQIRGDRTFLSNFITVQNCIVDQMSGSTMNNDGTVNLEYNGNGIGIQISQCDTYKLLFNTITNCKDNGIDTYNENVDYTVTPAVVYAPSGGKSQIIGNSIENCRCGIFPETSSRLIVMANYISGVVEAGIAINRINSAPDMMVIDGNIIEYAVHGIRVSGNCNSLRITDNWIGFITSGAGAGILCDNSSYILIERNIFKIAYTRVPLVAFSGAQGVFCHVTNNLYYGKPDLGYLTYEGSASMFGTTIEDWRAVSAIDGSEVGEGKFLRRFAGIDNLETIDLRTGKIVSTGLAELQSLKVTALASFAAITCTGLATLGSAKIGAVGFNGKDPRAAGALPADGTDLATTQALANQIKALLISFGLGQ